MNNSINYYLSLISPWSYLGHERLLAMAKAHKTQVNVIPVDFSIVFPSTGGIPLPKRSPERKAYRMQELKRWRDHSGIALNLEPKHFPVNDKLAASMVVNLRQEQPEQALLFAGACLKACWLEERDISKRETLLEIATENGIQGGKLLIDTDNSLAIIKKDSEAAVSSGVFGAPSYLYGEQLFWGQDRLDFLERALGAKT